jgi:hypothetical protein
MLIELLARPTSLWGTPHTHFQSASYWLMLLYLVWVLPQPPLPGVSRVTPLSPPTHARTILLHVLLLIAHSGISTSKKAMLFLALVAWTTSQFTCLACVNFLQASALLQLGGLWLHVLWIQFFESTIMIWSQTVKWSIPCSTHEKWCSGRLFSEEQSTKQSGVPRWLKRIDITSYWKGQQFHRRFWSSITLLPRLVGFLDSLVHHLSSFLSLLEAEPLLSTH